MKTKISCDNCNHFSQANPYKWGTCGWPLPWWVETNSPVIHPTDNNAKICDCYTPILETYDDPKMTNEN